MVFQNLRIFIFLYLWAKVHGTCHTCQSNFAVCHDERRFTMCTEGIPGDEMYTCPSGYVCTSETEICLKSSVSNPVEPTCEESCGLCTSLEKLFACLDETTYVYCFGEDFPDNSAIGYCPDGYVCNLGSNQVCSPASEVYPSCYDGASRAPTTLTPPTTSLGTTENSYLTDVTSTINPTDKTESVTDSKTSDSSSVTVEYTTESGIVTTDGATSSVTDQSPLTESPTPAEATTNDPTSLATSPLTDSPTSVQTTTDPPTILTTSPSTESPTPAQTTTNVPTSSATQPTLSTRNPRDESAFCKEKQNGGLYKAEGDPTCKEFILCYTLSGQYLGLKYTCLGSEFFNENMKQCQKEKPVGC